MSKIDLVKGETLVLTTDYNYKGDCKKLACSYPELAATVTPGQQILVADGSLVLTVLSVDHSTAEVSCRIEKQLLHRRAQKHESARRRCRSTDLYRKRSQW